MSGRLSSSSQFTESKIIPGAILKDEPVPKGQGFSRHNLKDFNTPTRRADAYQRIWFDTESSADRFCPSRELGVTDEVIPVVVAYLRIDRWALADIGGESSYRTQARSDSYWVAL